MSDIILLCGRMFDGVSETLSGPMEILVEKNRITRVARSVERPAGAEVIDLSDRTVSPGFIDTHVHLTMDASNLARQTLESSASKALKGMSLAREYMRYGFTTLRDLGSADPDWPTIDLRNAINAGIVQGRGSSLRLTLLVRVRVMAIYAASTTPAGHCRFPALPMTRHR